MNTIELDVEGMTCGSCVKHVTRALQAVPGVSRVDVDLTNGRVRVEKDLQVSSALLIAALSEEGYPAKMASEATPIESLKTVGCQSDQGSERGCCCRKL